ncbi:unnamed protein product [Coffea canephora]|uniref:WAT1-related protein n=1 Tax=Coffea canephora TaxID=49390 RepID=A0A068UX22_COFCA|nr:unnamed protein product [Coffea canephora]
MFNLIPGFTLVLALIFRLEKLDVRNSAGKAKVLGTVLGSGGAMILTFVKGKKIKILSQHVDIIPLHNHASVPSNNVVGSLLALLSCLSIAIWLVIQTKMSHSYPCYSSTAVMCFTGSILTGVLAICTERELSSWMLGWDCRLLAVAYLGIVSSGLCVAAVFWSSMMKGPLFVSSFSPLGLVFTALAGSLFLKEELCLGSLIGSIIITIGLCFVIWGKGKEATASQDGETESRRDEVTDGSQAAPPIVPGQCTDYLTNGVHQQFKHEHHFLLKPWFAISADTDTYRLSRIWNGRDRYDIHPRIADITIFATTRSDSADIDRFESVIHDISRYIRVNSESTPIFF